MQNYADRYQYAIRAAGLRYQTLRNYAWVSRQFSLDRRRPQLKFQHHAEVASLPLDMQDWWLDLAERMTWTTKQLRAHIQDERAGDGLEKDDTAVIPRIKVMESRLVRWRRAADQSGVDFQDWVLATLDRAADDSLSETVSVDV